MEDAAESPRPQPGPPPDADTPVEHLVDRRKVVLGLGFGAATIAGLTGLGERTTNRRVTTTSATIDTTSTTAPGAAVAVGEPGAPFVAPVFDETRRLGEGQTAEVSLTGGRIIDPETGFDRIGNVGIREGVIVAISDEAIAADRQIDATGLVIAPGFIDMLSYEPNAAPGWEGGEWWKVADGVTSNIGMHGLRFDADAFYSRWRNEGVPVHFGGAVHNSWVRDQLDLGIGDSADDRLGEVSDLVEAQIAAGYVGVHVQPEYAPGVSATEMLDMGRIAARFDVPLCVHARYSDNVAPGIQSEATAELVTVARETGAHVHIEHLNSTGGTGRMEEALAELETAIDEGLRMSSCMYPYEFWATGLQTSRYQDWQERYGLDYGDLQVAGSSERLTESTFAQAFEDNALTAAFAIPPGDLLAGLQAKFMMIGSDAILEQSLRNHPRATGCFSRVLGEYVRNRRAIELIDALAMMTIRPANLVGIGAPAMRSKGRMQIGADADVTVFDPETIIDRSTLADPARESVGVEFVFVDGVEVRNREGNVMEAPGDDGSPTPVRPGRAITSERG